MTNENCYQLFESKLDKFATSLSVLGSCRQTCSRAVQFGLKKQVTIFVHHSTALVIYELTLPIILSPHIEFIFIGYQSSVVTSSRSSQSMESLKTEMVAITLCWTQMTGRRFAF